MNKITLVLGPYAWKELSDMVVQQRRNISSKTDKYVKAILVHTLDQVHKKLYIKLPDLRPDKNRLNLTYPEAAVLAVALLELDSTHHLIISITGIIDQKLT